MTKTDILDSKRAMRSYMNWLLDLVPPLKKIGRINKSLARMLFDVPFVSLLGNDHNRIADGLRLREIFCLEKKEFSGYLPETGPCSILEMLIALSERMDHILSDERTGERKGKWFWLFLSNLELENSNDSVEINMEILERFVTRNYNSDGYGGLFPLKRPKLDQRTVEIWYQMSAYIEENF